ncbi:hypothetical protein Bbelb_264800 [Branchiostoma belcheri]|nr:hypothetical protein Bbelb_264800 [Branchiostoma belcheri]
MYSIPPENLTCHVGWDTVPSSAASADSYTSRSDRRDTGRAAAGMCFTARRLVGRAIAVCRTMQIAERAGAVRQDVRSPRCSSGDTPGEGEATEASRGTCTGQAEKTKTTEDSYHSPRLVGPLLIGGGIFIMLCGITALLENRDGETIRAPVIVLDPSCGPAGHQFDGYKSRFANFDKILSNSCPNLRYLPKPTDLNQQRGYLKHPPSPVPLDTLFPRRKLVRTPRKSHLPLGIDLSGFQHKASLF